MLACTASKDLNLDPKYPHQDSNNNKKQINKKDRWQVPASACNSSAGRQKWKNRGMSSQSMSSRFRERHIHMHVHALIAYIAHFNS